MLFFPGMDEREKTLEVTFSEMKFKNFANFLYRSLWRLVILRWLGPYCPLYVVVKVDFEHSALVEVVLDLQNVRKMLENEYVFYSKTAQFLSIRNSPFYR